MKKIAALALLVGTAASVSAQSSVTLFGVADVGVRQVENGDRSVSSLSGGGLSSSRLGFRGTEDLGGGLVAGFWLEAGINLDDGSLSDANRMFSRRSTVSLSSALGELRLGRDTTPTYTVVSNFDAFNDNGVAAGSKFFNKFGQVVDTTKRADNMVSYFLPSKIGGIYGSASAAAGESSTGKKYMGGRLGYKAGALDVTAAYGETTVAAISANEDKYKVMTFGASYDLGMFKLTGYVSENKYAALKTDVYHIGGSVPIGVGSLRAGYTSANSKGAGIDANDADQFALGYIHNLSKRTALYATVARVNNDGRAAYVVDGNPSLPSPNNGKASTGYEVGVRHSF
jgi:predicted porin